MASFYENLLNKRKGLHNSHRTGLEHQHGRRFIVLGHQHGRRDVMWKHFTAESTLFNPQAYKVFSHDVMAAILVSQNNETASMVVSQTNLLGVELFSYAKAFFCPKKIASEIRCWPREWKQSRLIVAVIYPSRFLEWIFTMAYF